jgi:putative NADH-flavin reductase
MKVTVVGASGRTGRLLVAQALEQGHEVTAFVRDVSKMVQAAQEVKLVQGDSMDVTTLARAISGSEAVLSALGHAKGSPGDLLAKSALAMVSAMRASGPVRLVLLTNTAVSDPSDQRSLRQGLIRVLLATIMRDVGHDSAEEAEIIRSSGLDWTIVRAAILTDGDLTHTYVAGKMRKNSGYTVSRRNVADFMLSCATLGTHIGETVYISDRR